MLGCLTWKFIPSLVIHITLFFYFTSKWTRELNGIVKSVANLQMSLLCVFKWTVTVVNVLEYDTVLTAHYVQYILYRSGNIGRGSQHYTRHRESCSTVSPAAGITSDSMEGRFACHSVLQSHRWDHCATVEIRMMLLNLSATCVLERGRHLICSPYEGPIPGRWGHLIAQYTHVEAYNNIPIH
jgi:hypothetical protein